MLFFKCIRRQGKLHLYRQQHKGKLHTNILVRIQNTISKENEHQKNSQPTDYSANKSMKLSTINIAPKKSYQSFPHIADLFSAHHLYSSRTMSVVRYKLESDDMLHERSPLSVQDIMALLEVCLKSTYFTFRGKFFSSY